MTLPEGSHIGLKKKFPKRPLIFIFQIFNSTDRGEHGWLSVEYTPTKIRIIHKIIRRLHYTYKTGTGPLGLLIRTRL